MNKTQAAKEILRKQDITSWFQPIIDVDTNELLGWEAFTKAPQVSPFQDATSLFQHAAEAGVLKPLDLMCMHHAANCFEQLQLEERLFVNLSSEVIVASGKLKDQIGDLIRDSAVPPTRMVLELDARSASTHVQALFSAVQFFQEQGFQIAINDVGASGSSQYLWAELKPEYVKVDRCYVNGINGDESKQELVREIVATARSLNAKVIAKGVETELELAILKQLGVRYVQGYLIQKPELSPVAPNLEKVKKADDSLGTKTESLACDLAIFHDKVNSAASVEDVYNRFEDSPSLGSIAVLENDTPVGMVYRMPFLMKLGTRQRRNVLFEKTISTEMDTDFLNVDSHIRLEQVIRLVTSRARLHDEQDFVISSQDKFLGIGTVVDLLRKITQVRTTQTRDLNLLTMLPGNIPVGDRVNDLLEKDNPFTIALLDLSNLKPFNNHYGYAKGDEVLVIFAELLRKHINQDTDFVGHIGGDDFVMVVQPDKWQQVFCSLFNEFSQKIQPFYSDSDIEKGGIQSTDYLGDDQLFDFITINAGVVTLSDEYFESFQALLSHLIKLKHRTKKEAALRIAHQHKRKVELYNYVDRELDCCEIEKMK